jgi:RNase H-fold protein (predicted Holliday junction resolvase)
MLDLTIILQMIAILGAFTGVMGFLWKIVNKQDVLAERMTNTESQLKKMVDIVTEVARQDERLNAMAATQSGIQTSLLALSERISSLAATPIKNRRA